MLTADEARRLERLALSAPAMAHAGGARQAGARGSGVEFQDYRAYQPGDDVRSIDWTVEARLRHLVIRVTEAEGHLPLHVLVDVSGSMGIGAPTKLQCAARLAAALCYVAAGRRDPLGVTTFADRLKVHLPAAAGRGQLFRALEILRGQIPQGQSSLRRSLDDYGAVARGAALVIVVSDFLGDADIDGLRQMLARRQLPVIVQVLADEDVDPTLSSVTELVDVEDPAAAPVIAHPEVLASYRQQLERVTASLREFCHAHGRPYVQVRSSAPFDALVTACVNARILQLHG